MSDDEPTYGDKPTSTRAEDSRDQLVAALRAITIAVEKETPERPSDLMRLIAASVINAALAIADELAALRGVLAAGRDGETARGELVATDIGEYARYPKARDADSVTPDQDVDEAARQLARAVGTMISFLPAGEYAELGTVRYWLAAYNTATRARGDG